MIAPKSVLSLSLSNKSSAPAHASFKVAPSTNVVLSTEASAAKILPLAKEALMLAV